MRGECRPLRAPARRSLRGAAGCLRAFFVEHRRCPFPCRPVPGGNPRCRRDRVFRAAQPPKAGPAGSTRCAGSVQRRRLRGAVAARRGGPRLYGAALGQLAGGSVRGPNASRRGQQGSSAHRAAQESQYASECGHRPGRLDQLRGACRVGVNQHLVINVSNEPVANIFP